MTENILPTPNEKELTDNINIQDGECSGHTEPISDNDEMGPQEPTSSSMPAKEQDNAERLKVQKMKDPLHGVTLEQILVRLVECYGWDGLSENIRIRCFINNPSIKSSLTFLRKTPWARKKVENLYINECI